MIKTLPQQPCLSPPGRSQSTFWNWTLEQQISWPKRGSCWVAFAPNCQERFLVYPDSKEILHFIQTLVKVGRKEGGMETMPCPPLWPSYFPVLFLVLLYRAVTYSADVGKREVRIPTLGKDDSPQHSSSWWGQSLSPTQHIITTEPL